MVRFQTTISRFQKKGEKTGWTYITISAKVANQLNPGSKVSFRVKGLLDKHPIAAVALLPMGEGNFILPFNAAIRKGTRKTAGDKVSVQMELDSKPLKLSTDLMKCLKQEPEALKFFKTLPPSHQHYFSKWIEGAKTLTTKTKRITMTLMAMVEKKSYGEMMRAYRDE